MSVRRMAGLLGFFIVAGVALMAVLAPWITPYDAFAQDLTMRMIPPAFMEGGRPDHLLGTDQLGRDVLSRILYGSRASLLVSAASVGLALLAGGTLGLLAAY